MKKGQKVRVIADGRIGQVVDRHIVNLRGKRHVSVQVKFPETKGDAPWFPSDQLITTLQEKASIVITGEKGRLHLTFTYDHDSKGYRVDTKSNDAPLCEQEGLHVMLALALNRGLMVLSQESMK